MAQSTKTLLIRLNGEVATGAGKVADKLNEIGNVLDRVGRYTREIEEESVEIYRGYEDNMLAAKFALSAQVESATELERQMTSLGEAAQKWASTTIFHTDDVSAAILEATRAGWDYEKILQGIPKAMLIAQAGGMDLSAGLDYLIKMVNTTGTSFDDVGTMVDQWAKAANSSATSIDEMGQAFMALSASAMFADNTQELFTLTAVLANAGVTGSKAGTLLRNAMMRMIAPTDKAKKAMQDLGASEEDLEAWAEKGATAEQLEKLGFSAYTATGELKPMKTILTDLHDALAGMTEQQQYDILSTIFPLRSINAATAFMKSIESGNLEKLYNSIGDSEGYAQKGADIMMSGITGAIETLKSKWEEFERSIGETLAPSIETIAGFLGQIVDGFNNMDESQMSGLTSMLNALSAVGPLAIGVGLIAKLAALLTPLGLAALVGGAGIAYLVGYLTSLSEIQFKNNFGTLQVDLDELGAYVDGVKSKFDLEQEYLTEFQNMVDEAQKNYETKLNQMNEGLLKKVLKGEEFTDKDYEIFTQLGTDMVKYVNQGIDNASARDNSFLQAIFGDKESAKEMEAFENAAQMLDFYYADLSSEAYAIGEGIRLKLTEALGNGELTSEDREYIQAQVDRLNQIQAEIANRMAEQDYYTQLYKAGRVSWDTVEGFLNDNKEKMEASQKSIDEQYDSMIGRVKAAYARARRNGGQVTYTDINGESVTLTSADMSAEAEAGVIAEIERERAASHKSETDKFGDISATAFDTLMKDSGFGDAWRYINEIYKQYGGIPVGEDGMADTSKLWLTGMTDAEIDKLTSQLLGLDSADSSWLGLGKGKLTELLKKFSGHEGVDDMITMLDSAFGLMAQLSAYSNRKHNYEEYGRDPLGEFSTPEMEERSDSIYWLEQDLSEKKNKLNGLREQIAQYDRAIENENKNILKSDAEKQASIAGYEATRSKLINELTPQINEAEAEIAELQAEIDALRTANAMDNLRRQGAQVTEGEGGLQEVIAQVGGYGGVDVMANIDGDATDLHATIMDEDGQVLKEFVDGDATQLEALLKTYEGRTIRVKITGTGFLTGFAEGGRADTPSIFGEAGAEWAIPEEHSERTAQLLDAARRASGFSWGDLIGRYGGLNANPQSSPVVLNYSPVINAGDANGVASALAADKDKLVRFIRQALDESRYRQSVEAFA